MTSKRAADFPEGTQVLYVPLHAKGDPKHESVEKGIVKGISTAADLVFVMFGADTMAKACRPDTLQPVEEEKAPDAKIAPVTATAPGTSGDAAKAPGDVQGGPPASVDKGKLS